MEINDKTKAKDLKKYIEDNDLQKAYQEKYKKRYDKSRKDELLKFIEEQRNMKEMEDKVEMLFGTTTEETINENEILDDIKNDIKKEDDDIEEIPIFKREQMNKESSNKEPNNKEPNDIKLNESQLKALRYINRFPDKLKSITSRPTFKQEFSKLRGPLSDSESIGKTPEDIDKENNENIRLLSDIERTLSSANINGLVLDQIFVTVDAIETIIIAIRENKNGNIPSYIVNTVGQVRIEGLSEKLLSNQAFHDCIDELLIKYDTYESILGYLNVETRLLLIIVGTAYFVHKGNVKKEQLEKENSTDKGRRKADEVRSKYGNL